MPLKHLPTPHLIQALPLGAAPNIKRGTNIFISLSVCHDLDHLSPLPTLYNC
jgi:hypothetical protein